jgi:hypothetical protein
MTYAIDTLLRLCEENTRLKLGHPLSKEDGGVFLEVSEKHKHFPWDLLDEIDTSAIVEYLTTEHSYHIYAKPPPTVDEMEKLKESADLIAESQQKQINLLLEDKRERMEDRERLLKRICELEDEVGSHRGRGRPKKTECVPCISDPAV